MISKQSISLLLIILIFPLFYGIEIKQKKRVKKNPKRCGGGKKYTERKIEKKTKLNVLQTFHFNLV
jgi:hypothetical protein